jgi:uncharacterized damage-inducible protein DinB
MTAHEAKVIGAYLAGVLRMEMDATKKVLGAIPDGGFDYRPDEKSMKALDLAKHIAEGEVMLIEIAVAGGDVPPPTGAKELTSPAAVVAWYEQEVAAGLAKVDGMEGEQLAKVLSVWGGMVTMPAVNFLRLASAHSIHHRGQLSSYLRPMGAKVPSIYGPSGDSAS